MKAIIVADYEINKSFIAENYCVNKNKPELKCHGSCHLKKQLDKEEKSRNFPSGNSKNKFENIFFNENNEKIMNEFFTNSVKYQLFYKSKTTIGFSNPLYHPPEIS